MPDNLRGLLRDLPSLPTRHAILLVWASELPVLAHMNALPERHRPKSDDPDFWGVWSGQDSKARQSCARWIGRRSQMTGSRSMRQSRKKIWRTTMSNSQASKAEQGTEEYFFRASPADFAKIPGSPIAYWLPQPGINAFSSGRLEEVGKTRRGLQTGAKDRFIRYWHECSRDSSEMRYLPRDEAIESNAKWFMFNNGGDFKKWYGNLDLVVNWAGNGSEIKAFDGSIIPSEDLYFQSAVSWPRLTSGEIAFKLHPEGVIPGDLSPCYYSERTLTELGYLNSKCLNYFLKAINPTVTSPVGDVAKVPTPRLEEDLEATIRARVDRLIEVHKADWNSYEASWDFIGLPLLRPDYRQPTLKASYQNLRAHWREMTLEMQRLEEENNRIFIDAYGLQNELKSKVPLNEITLTCNPHYRYGNDKSEGELEALLLADTMRELVSYAVGCMFGRYSLDKPGLILANQGETVADYLALVPEPRVSPDEDNVIPLLDGDWFTDDITQCFRHFLRVAFGEGHYEENLLFVEQALNLKGKRNYSIRDYFLSEFYADHVKRYKKRPIYWLFSSPKGSFNALIYMHRYRPDTVSVVLNDYLREFRAKLTSHKNHLEAVSISASASQTEKTKALKEIEKITKVIAEMEGYEREVLYPLATEQVEIDLDDGVKVNYPKLGAALKKIVGLDAAED
ncbi:BREX-1 system adenine-specific DNA-methyltransferase PglX [Paraburkholderia steynii]|uniref:BREX-1 system adenine-specific DNA-methyltransferase PglX n=1 Tax=Paraburkholderia steynii TaxID=1245441 RepID=UPI001ABE5DE6|nr:BREX-1 system adenine-specific DNA-methyltransferase PglX [Paraburkholderia steynii]